MSLVDDIKGLWRRVKYTFRENFVSRENYRYGDEEVNVSSYEEVVVSVANRDFALVYPPNQPLCSVDRTINPTSWLNLLLALLASLATGVSLIMLFLMLATFAAYPLLSAAFFTFFTSHLSLALPAAAGLFVSGLCFRKFDRALTMLNCLKGAEEKLQDPRLRHQEVALLECSNDEAEIDALILQFDEAIAKGEETLKRVAKMCYKIECIPDLAKTEIEAELAPHKQAADKLRHELARFKQQRLDALDRKRIVQQRAEKTKLMTDLIDSGPILASVSNGGFAAELDSLNQSMSELFDKIDIKRKWQEKHLLIDAGLGDDKKPPQIE